MNIILNKYLNINNKRSYSKYNEYQSHNKISSSLSVLSKEKNKKLINNKTGICSTHSTN